MQLAKRGAFTRLGFEKIVPSHIGKWPCRTSDPPMQHPARQVVFQDLSKAGKCFFLVKAKAPVQALLKQGLRHRRRCADQKGTGSKVKAEHISFHSTITLPEDIRRTIVNHLPMENYQAVRILFA